MGDKMSVNDYLLILRKMLVKNRSVVKESYKYYKVYLPSDFNQLWNVVYGERRKVDIIVFLPHSVSNVDKILMMNRNLSRENNRFKIYLDKRYNDIWKFIHQSHEKVDLIIVLK